MWTKEDRKMEKYYRENGRFCTRIYLGTDECGKRKYKKLKAATEKELDRRVFEFKKALDAGLDVNSASDTLAEWIGRYIEHLENEAECGNFRESEVKTAKARLGYFSAYRGGLLVKTKLRDVLPSHIQTAVTELYRANPSTGKPSAKRTIERYVRALAGVFEYARRQRAYNFCNPCDDVTVPKNAVTTQRSALSEHTISLIMTTEHRAKLPACIMLFAGLRRGELTALTWADVDLKRRVIDVNKSYDFKHNTVKGTKTAAGMRRVPINDFLYDLLAQAKANSRGMNVIEKMRGGVMTEQAWKVLFRSYILALGKADAESERGKKSVRGDGGFEPFTIHQLRHTYCSMLQWSGVDIKTAQELMGHSEYGVTANIYTHVNEETKRRAARMQSEYIKATFLGKTS